MINIGALYPGGPLAQVLVHEDCLIGCTIEAHCIDYGAGKLYLRVSHPDLLEDRKTFVMLSSLSMDSSLPELVCPPDLSEYMNRLVRTTTPPCPLAVIGVFTDDECERIYYAHQDKIRVERDEESRQLYERLKARFDPAT